MSSIPEQGSSSGIGNGNPHQYSCLEYPMDRGAWPATVHGVTKSQTQLRDFSLNILWHCPSLGLEQKLIFSSPVATTEFSKCWHNECSTLTTSSFKILIALLEFYHLHQLCLQCCFLRILEFTFYDVWLQVSDHTIMVIYEKQLKTILGGSKITADSDCSCEIKKKKKASSLK